MKLLDLYCGAGGAAYGFYKQGIEDITGIDINMQKNYPFNFIQKDVLEITPEYCQQFDLIWASPPCQNYTWASKKHRNKGKEYPDLISNTRTLLNKAQKPYIIENVSGAPIRHDLMLCGEMFNLRVIRHRYFELSEIYIPQPKHKKHKKPVWRKSKIDSKKKVKRSWYYSVVGNGGESFSYKLSDWKKAMEIDWMTKEELVESIPPAYTEYMAYHILNTPQSPKEAWTL